ncbi:MAG: translation initiation factor IF-2 [Gemmatimonadales bacterium]|nr:translation initiation factor IF-2 [Gemmatimonadales bacterium]NIN50185.1 translation initiation factor IF-2 [Gemmatimonadales bacterium]NIP07649.1 translation initiation factor IF-2 [Gemmatimonadales bacterium]NIR01801.1 translation initiation factor IF-2 [Gemmatimonadales bacterium]NIS65704.1 translation initiation factor IF-2 [Gemmatimonadales bacterium]
MGKTRIHDLAAEFGIESGQLITLLADMGIHVRSHLSGLDDGQVARVRTRWEREKRRTAEPEAKTRGRRRKKATGKAAAKTASARATEARPRRRRRTAAQVAAMAAAEEEAQREAEEAAERAAAEAVAEEAAAEEKPSIEERAAALFKEPAEAEVAAMQPAEPPAPEPEPVVEVAAPPEPPKEEAPPPPEAAAEAPEAEPVKPTPVERVATPSRLRPVASSGPRPVASAVPGEIAEERRREKKRRRKGKRSQVDKVAVQANISRTLASLKGTAVRKPTRRRDDEPSARELAEQQRAEEREREKTLVRVNEFITVSELASVLNTTPTEIVTFCFKELGMMVTVNQRLDFDQIDLIAGAFGFKAVQEEEYVPAETIMEEVADTPDNLSPRAPVVTVMGHVDHGKTSLLDYVRKTNVIAGESGGITQHIGAYHAVLPAGRVITFLDTPGHEAFTAMRARGAQVTDIVVLVVAADDRVMPQTVEAISHAKNAGVPMVVAINKIDLPDARPEQVKQDLLKHDVVLEEYGGETMGQAISAKSGDGIDELLEKILLQAELLDKKANPKRLARGTVIESALDPGKGPVATVLVQNGTLNVGDNFICGNLAGRVRAMHDERSQRAASAGPSVPVQVLGFDGVAQAGDTFMVVPEHADARDIAQKRQRLDREASHRRSLRGISLEEVSKQIEEGAVKSLDIIIKADQAGPAEALADAFAQLSTAEVKVEVIHRGVGAITESDVVLAKASHAIIVGFNVRPDGNARAAAERERVDIRTYRVIYDALEDVRAALEGMLAPEEKEVVLGEAEVRQLFKISGVGTIAGCFVRNGVIRRDASIRVIRDGVEVYDGVTASLRRFKDDVREVKEGFECGIGIENFNDVKVGDVLEAYQIEEIARSLETAGAVKDA